MDRKKVIGTAAGAAAAATAVGIAAVTMRNRKPTILHVRQKEDTWVVEAEGGKPAATHHDTKRDAVKAARDRATAGAPSQLIIHRRDGSVQKHHAYERE